MITIEEIIKYGINELNALVVYGTILISWPSALFTMVLWRIAKRKTNLKIADLNALEERFEIQKKLLSATEEELQNERMLTTKYWLDKAAKEKIVEDGLPQEYAAEVLQDGMTNLIPSFQQFILKAGLSRYDTFLLTDEEVQLQEAERLVRIASLLVLGDKHAKDISQEIIEEVVKRKFSQGNYNPDDPILLEPSFDKITSMAASPEEVIKRLINYGIEAFEKGMYYKSERIFSRARNLAITAFGRRERIAIITRYWHHNAARSLGLYTYCQKAIDLLLTDCSEGLSSKDDPLFLNVRCLKIRILESLGEYKDALNEMNELLPDYERVIGKDHPDTLSTRHLKINILNNLDQYQDALEEINELEIVEERVFGKDHPDALSTRYLKIKILKNSGQYSDALEEINVLLPIEERVIGKEHPNTLLTRNLRVHILDNLGEYKDALNEINKLLPVEERVIGKEHPNTLASLHLKIKILVYLGEHQDALDQINELLPVEERVIGKEHSDTLASRQIKIKILDNLGQCSDALGQINELLPVVEHVFGKEHPNTLSTRQLRDEIIGHIAAGQTR